MLKIGLFSLKDNVGCTSMTIHIANYLADIVGITVAVVEPKKKNLILNSLEDSVYASVNADYEDDGTFVINKVRYYPSKRRGPWIYDSYELVDEEVEPTEDIVIYDFGHVGFLHEFESDFDKLYLCTDGENIADEISFVKDTKTNPDVILFGASKEILAKYQEYSFKCILVGNKKEERLPSNFASSLEIFLRLNKITPPKYHKDWTYAPVEFNYKPAPKPEEKQSFFDKMFSKKKKKEKKAEVVEEPKEIVTSDVGVANKDAAKEANEFSTYNFVDVPAPEDNDEPEEIIEATETPSEETKLVDESTEEIKDDADTNKDIEAEPETKETDNKTKEELEKLRLEKEMLENEKRAVNAEKKRLKEEAENIEKSKEEHKKLLLAEEEAKKQNELAAKILAEEQLRQYKQIEDMKNQAMKDADEKILAAKEEERKKWEYEALHDEMTGLLNKKAFNKAIQDFDISVGALIFIDVNDLKKTNDTKGHDAGDKLIKKIASEFLVHFENEAYRVGGDEFVILTSCDKKQIEKKIDIIQKDLVKESKIDKEQIVYSVAHGIAYCDGIKDVFALKSEADALMYENKKAIKAKRDELNLDEVKPEENKTKTQAAKTKGLLGKLIKQILKDEANVCGIYIVTKDKKLIIFDNPDSFFNKLELLKRELRDIDRIHYIIISHFDEKKEDLITDDKNLDDDIFSFLEALDDDLRVRHLTEDDIYRHKELILFDEILIT